MNVTLLLVVLVIVIALIFDFTNGFHDAANAIATVVATRALPPRVALLIAAGANLLGALLGTGVAKTIAEEIIVVPEGNTGLATVLGALFGAITWNLITWWKGLPSSSSHALIGGLCGAGLATVTQVHWLKIVDKVILPMIFSPIVGFVLAFGAMKFVLWLLAERDYKTTMRHFRWFQIFSSTAVALGHGLQDAQKTMGIMVLALVAGGYHSHDMDIPFLVILGAASAISLGTYCGGGRIMKTLGRGVIQVDPARGFVSECISAKSWR